MTSPASRPSRATGPGPAGASGVGIGWRLEIDLTVPRLPGLDFVEIVAENVHPDHVPAALMALHGSGTPVIPHGVSLSLGGADPLDPAKLARLSALASAFGSPLVSEHVAFCRAGGIEAGHLLPVPRTRAALDVLVETCEPRKTRCRCRSRWRTSPRWSRGPRTS